VIVSHHSGSVNEQNATVGKIVSVVHGNCDFDPIRFRAKITDFRFLIEYRNNTTSDFYRDHFWNKTVYQKLE